VSKGLEQIQIAQGGASVPKKPLNPRLQLIWGATMYHIDDLPFPVSNLPDVYTQFRKVGIFFANSRPFSRRNG
jgi:deoxyribodipyrimidine photo-lyase